MKSNKHVLTILMAAVALCPFLALADDDAKATNSALASATSKIDEMFPDVVVAKGKGIEIKRSRLEEEITAYRRAREAQGLELTPRDLPLIEKMSYDHLVDVALVTPGATDKDRAKAALEVEKQIADLKRREPSAGAFEAKLKGTGLTLAELRARLLEEAVMKEVLRDKISVTDGDLKKFYDANPDKFMLPEMVHLNHVLFMTVDRSNQPLAPEEKKAKMKKAEEVVKRARDGEDFSKLVDEYSEDPTAKNTHGELTLPRDTGHVPKQFEAAAFALTPGQVSEVVISDMGYHVIKAIERIPAKKDSLDTPVMTNTLESGASEIIAVKDQLRSYLEDLEIMKILPSVVEPLKKEAKIEILDEQLKNSVAAAEEYAKKVNAMNAAPLKPGEKKDDSTGK